MPMSLEVAANWSTDAWSQDGNPPGDRRPPLPGETPEDAWIGRQTVFVGEQFGGHYGPFTVVIPSYNPEWVSIDIRGFNVNISGRITHECLAQSQEPMDLAFVITGDATQDCCVIRGDINHSGSGPDIADLVYLVSYMFQGGPTPPCSSSPGYYDEADVNGSSSGPDIADLVYLVSYMFQGGPAPVPCP
jgi:hypothetical protein